MLAQLAILLCHYNLCLELPFCLWHYSPLKSLPHQAPPQKSPVSSQLRAQEEELLHCPQNFQKKHLPSVLMQNRANSEGGKYGSGVNRMATTTLYFFVSFA